MADSWAVRIWKFFALIGIVCFVVYAIGSRTATKPTPDATPDASSATVAKAELVATPTPSLAPPSAAIAARSLWNDPAHPEYADLLKPQTAKQKAAEKAQPIRYAGPIVSPHSVIAGLEEDLEQASRAYDHNDTEYLQGMASEGRIIVTFDDPIKVIKVIRQHDGKSHENRIQFLHPNGQLYWTYKSNLLNFNGTTVRDY
jgi:hypothetical protein